MNLALQLLPVACVCAMASLRAHAQTKSTCLFVEHFSADSIPTDWNVGPLVHLQDDLTGTNTDSLTKAWGTGRAEDVTGAYFVIPPDAGSDGFAFANDDGDPCNCDMESIALLSPLIDLSGSIAPALRTTFFYDGLFDSGALQVEASTNGTDFTALAQPAPNPSEWQDLTLDLDAFAGGSMWLRFSWSDNGNWSTGVAIDEVCVYERLDNDLTLQTVVLADLTADPQDQVVRNIPYPQLPLQEAGPTDVTVVTRNSGSLAQFNVVAQCTLTFNGQNEGSFSDTLPILAAGAEDTIVIRTEWVPPALGTLQVLATISANSNDEDMGDNALSVDQVITGPGWESSYGSWAQDQGPERANTLLTTSGERIVTRYEAIGSTSFAQGVSLVLRAGSTLGSTLRGELFDVNRALVATTEDHVLSQGDLDQGQLFLPFEAPVMVQPGDVYASVQLRSGSDTLMLRTAGPAATGAAYRYVDVDWQPLSGAPAVRLHLESYGVGVGELGPPKWLRASPIPTRDEIQLSWPPASGRGFIELFDPSGRSVLSQPIAPGLLSTSLFLSRLPSGTYQIQVVFGTKRSVTSIVVL
jgi:hypothetical protein